MSTKENSNSIEYNKMLKRKVEDAYRIPEFKEPLLDITIPYKRETANEIEKNKNKRNPIRSRANIFINILSSYRTLNRIY